MAQRLAALVFVCVAMAAGWIARLSRVTQALVPWRPDTRDGGRSTAPPSDGRRWRPGLVPGAALLGVLALSPGLVARWADEAPMVSERVAASTQISSSAKVAPAPKAPASGSQAGDGIPVASLGGGQTEVAQQLDPEAEPAAEASIPAASAGDVASAPPPEYVVRPGDTIGRIAAAHGLDAAALARANRLANPDHILVGQRLRLTEATALAGAGRSTPSSNEAFILSLVPGAQASQRSTGVPASVTLAQAILETFWGSSYLAREANNYFGIKAYARPGTAGVVWIDAWEVEDGRNVTRREPFRSYNDPGESLLDHGRFFLENPRYAHAMEATHDPREFARRINRAGYATDPAYAGKLISFMDRYNLYQWDVAR